MVWQFTILESNLTKPPFFAYYTLYLVHKGVRTQISAAVHKDVALFGAQRCKIYQSLTLQTVSGMGRIGMDFSLVHKDVAHIVGAQRCRSFKLN